MDKSALPLAEVLDDPEEIDRRYADFERQEAQKKIDRLAEAERLKDVAKRKDRLIRTTEGAHPHIRSSIILSS
jgi:hypothetical protein